LVNIFCSQDFCATMANTGGNRLEFRIGAVDHTQDDPDAEYPELRDPQAEAHVAKQEKLKKASVEFRTLTGLDGSLFILFICALVMVDVSISLSGNVSDGDFSFQV
jgi:hypothetical protein